MGHLVRAFIELSIAQRVVRKPHRNALRRPLNLLFEQFVQTLLTPLVDLRKPWQGCIVGGWGIRRALNSYVWKLHLEYNSIQVTQVLHATPREPLAISIAPISYPADSTFQAISRKCL